MIESNMKGALPPNDADFKFAGAKMSFLSRLSAYAQNALCRFTGNSDTGVFKSRFTKMIPAVMLAVFAFANVNAQVYQYNFEASSGPTSPYANLTASQFSGGNRSTSDECSGDYSYRTNESSGTYEMSVTLTVASGYQLDISSITSTMKKHGGSSGTVTANIFVEANSNTYTGNNPVANLNNNSDNGGCQAVTFTTPLTGLTGTVVIKWAGNRSNSRRAYLDNVIINGDVTPVSTSCVTASAFNTAGSGNICLNPSGGSIPVTLNGSQAGLNYELYNGSTLVTTLTGTGADLTYSATTAGTYTWVAVAGTSTICGGNPVDMNGSAVVTVSQPTASFATVANNGEFCAGTSSVEFYIEGTPNANVTWNATGGSTQSGIVQIQPNGKATIVLNDVSATTTVNLTQVQNTTGSNGCVETLTGISSTATVREKLALTDFGSSQERCVTGALSNTSPFGILTYQLNGAATGNRIVGYQIDGGTTQYVTVPAGITNANTVSNGAINVSSLDLSAVHTYTVSIVSVRYEDPTIAGGSIYCEESVSGQSVTLTVEERPAFDFRLIANGNSTTLTAGGSDSVCVPATGVQFQIFDVTAASTSGLTYTIVKSGSGAFTSSGNITGNGSGVIPRETTPGGTYTVTVNDPNGCATQFVYTVIEVEQPTFAYSINGSAINAGDTFALCADEELTWLLESNQAYGYNICLEYLSGGIVPMATVCQFSASGTLTGTNFDHTHTVTVPYTDVDPIYYVGTAVVTSALGGCDSTITFYVKVNPLPNVSGSVVVNGSQLEGAGDQADVCENDSVTVQITGTPGHTVEIHYVYTNDFGTFPVSGYTQIPTGNIGSNGTYTYKFLAPAYQASTDNPINVPTPNAGAKRYWYKVEVKDNQTFCSNFTDFTIKVNQKARINVAYTKTQPTTDEPGDIEGTPVNLDGSVVDTINICYGFTSTLNSEIKLFFSRDASNNSYFDGIADANQITFELVKDGSSTPSHNGILNPGDDPNTYLWEVGSANSSGLYHVIAHNPSGCDSITSFWVNAYAAPVFTYTTSASVICEGEDLAVTLTGKAGQTQTYTLERIGGTGPVPSTTQWNGSLTATATTVDIAGLLAAQGDADNNGTHEFKLYVESDPGACGKTETFTITVNRKPVPVLNVNQEVIVPGTTYNYCEDDSVHYTITGVPTGAYYELFRGTTKVAQGNTTNLEHSVLRLDIQTFNAGTYKLVVQNGSTSCDSSFEFIVTVGERPKFAAAIAVTNNAVCYGDSIAYAEYQYTAVNLGSLAKPIELKLYKGAYDEANHEFTHTVAYNPNGSGIAGGTLTGLTSGTYYLQITNLNTGCLTVDSFVVSEVALAPLTITTSNLSPSCPGAKAGSIDYAVAGGNAGYNVRLFDGNGNGVPGTDFNSSTEFGNSFTGLAAGNYTIVVRDANGSGCEVRKTFTITGCDAPDLNPALVTTVNGPNYIIGTGTYNFGLDIYNDGQSATNGTNIVIAVNVPSGFTLESVGGAGIAVAYVAGNTYTVTLSSAAASVAVNDYTNIGLRLVEVNPAQGMATISVTIMPNSGGDVSQHNNSNTARINVIKQ